MSEAVGAYNTITASPEYQELERMRLKAGHDEAQALYNAEKRGAEAEREKWQGVVAEITISKDVELESKAAEIESKDAEIEKLRAKIELLQKSDLIHESTDDHERLVDTGTR